MRSNILKNSFLASLSLAVGCLVAPAAQYITDFNGGLPPGSALAGNAFVDTSGGVGNSGVLKVTTAGPGQQGAFYVNDFVGGAPVVNFVVSARVAIGGGTQRPADGMAFAFGNDVGAPPNTFGEEGVGTGISVTFDTWDNNGADTAPAIEILYGGVVIASQSMATNANGISIREGARPAAGPILTDSAGNPVSLQTLGSGALPNDGSFVNLAIELDADNTISVSWSNVVVFSHVPIPYVPISGGTWAFGARTGGATEDHWIDNLALFANFTPAAAAIVTQPADQTVIETHRAVFSVEVSGTPPFSAQWFSNNVAIPGADQLSYTTPPAKNSMNGALYRVEVRNSQNATPVVSANATLTVIPGLVMLSANPRNTATNVFVVFNKPAQRVGSYSLSPAVAINAVKPGPGPDEVLLETAPLTLDVNYTLTVTGEKGTDNTVLVPDPATAHFHYGFGAFCHDFNDNVLPAGTVVSSASSIGGGFIHLTEATQFGACGDYWIPDQVSGSPLDRLQARWRSYIGDGGGGGADGYSFSWSPDLPNPGVGCYGGEEGAGTGLSVTVDTFDNGGGETGLEIRWKGQRVVFQHIDKDNGGSGVYLRKSQFVDASFEVLPNGLCTFNYDGTIISTTIPDAVPVSGANFLFAGRTGGASDNQWIDDVRLNCFTLGPPVFTLSPVDTTVIEGDPATFIVAVDGAPPLQPLQWYTNGVLVAGASGSHLTLPGIGELNGTQVYATDANDFGSVTSSTGRLHVTLAPRIVKISMGCEPNIVHIQYTKPVLLNGTYSTDIAFVNGVSYGASQSEVVLDIDPLSPGNVATVSIQDEHDLGGNVQYPNPASGVVAYGFGSLCTDFSALPQGAQLQGSAALGADGIIHLTDDGANGVCGSLLIPDQNSGAPLDRLHMTFQALIGGVDQTNEAQQFGTGGADGISLSWGSDVNLGCAGPNGTGNGLIVTVDTFDNGSGCGLPECGGESPAITIKWHGNRVAANYIGSDPAANKNFLRKGTFVNAEVDVFPNGTAQFTYDGVPVQAVLPGWTGIAGGKFLFSASTGGAQDNQWIDNVCINSILPDTNGPVLFCPNIVKECTGGLTPVTYTVSAFDLCGGPAVATCTPPSGTLFRLGLSNVVCQTTDGAGNNSSCAFIVAVVDTTPPTVTCNSNIVADATSTNGAAVSYIASAFDACGIQSLVCLPTGNVFPVGTTTVTCIGVDSVGNSNSCNFTVTVNPFNAPPVCASRVVCSFGTTNANVIALDGATACVILDGSASSDPEGQPVTIHWTIDGTNNVAGTVVTNCLELGCHTVVVNVSDGHSVTTCETNVCVITACEAVEQCIALVDGASIDRKNKRPFIATLKAACASFDRGDFIPAMNQLEAFQNKVAAQVARANPSEAAAFITCAQQILDAINCGATAALGGH